MYRPANDPGPQMIAGPQMIPTNYIEYRKEWRGVQWSGFFCRVILDDIVIIMVYIN